MADTIIEVKNLKVTYNKDKSNEVRSLDDINVKIYPEEYVIIFGPSGCGKSTLLYAIAGLQAATEGEITVEGKDLAKMKKKEKVELHQTGVGMIFQAFYLISSINVLDNVILPKVFRGEERHKRKEDGMKLLRRFSIAEQNDKFPSQLSGGQKQRVAIARALVNNPSIILADEPVGNLDSESAENVLNILKELNEVDKKTIILVTHNAEHLHFADRILHMKDGKLVSEEINRDKRPKDALKEDIAKEPDVISSELKLLMRTFRNFSPQQIGGLLIPYKAKQLINHIIMELTEEQITAAENFLKDLLFKNIQMEAFEKNIDLDLKEGGAGWNKLRAKSFSVKVNDITSQAEALAKDYKQALPGFADYLLRVFDLKLQPEIKARLLTFLRLRLENKIDAFGVQERLDAPVSVGGVGLYKNTSEKMMREIEMVMLLKYSV
ncbi:MAG: ABC transporter ATP-binding protein [Parcubacteria group bacterium]